MCASHFIKKITLRTRCREQSSLHNHQKYWNKRYYCKKVERIKMKNENGRIQKPRYGIVFVLVFTLRILWALENIHRICNCVWVCACSCARSHTRANVFFEKLSRCNLGRNWNVPWLLVQPQRSCMAAKRLEKFYRWNFLQNMYSDCSTYTIFIQHTHSLSHSLTVFKLAQNSFCEREAYTSFAHKLSKRRWHWKSIRNMHLLSLNQF